MRMMQFSPAVKYVPGKEQITADALSRATASGLVIIDFVEEEETFSEKCLSILPATEARTAVICR